MIIILKEIITAITTNLIVNLFEKNNSNKNKQIKQHQQQTHLKQRTKTTREPTIPYFRLFSSLKKGAKETMKIKDP